MGIAISHAHEDHYGALLDFWARIQVPVFMTPFAAALLEAKRAGEPTRRRSRSQSCARANPFRPARSRSNFSVSHSIPESNALAIRTPAGTVVHTGDWKLDPSPGAGPATDSDRFASLGEEGVLALVSDSTNAIRDGVSPSEGEVAKVLERLITEAPQRVAVTTFASNVGRFAPSPPPPTVQGARWWWSDAPSAAPWMWRASSATWTVCRNSSTRRLTPSCRATGWRR